MLVHRIYYGCVSIVLAATGLAWLIDEDGRAPRHTGDLIPDRYYSIHSTGERSTLKLEFTPTTRYLLIASSLGDAGRSHALTLTARHFDGRPSFRGARLRPWEPTNAFPIQPIHDDSRLSINVGSSSSETTDKSVAGQTYPIPTRRSFHLHVTDGDLNDPRQYTRVQARMVAEGRDVRIYLDEQQSIAELDAGVLDELVFVMDNDIIPDCATTLGTYRDVDGDRKFTLLMSPWLDRLQGGGTSLGGFVRGDDFQLDVEPPFGNRCDMLYLNSNVRPGANLKTLLAHEYAHAVCFSERLSQHKNRRRLPDEEDWLNEAIAHLSENLHGAGWSNIDHRVSCFLTSPESYPLVVADYYRSGLWRDHGCRGATYLFLRWCVDQFGEGLLRKLVHSRVTGRQGLEQATGVPFTELYRRWTIALFESGRVVETRQIQAAGHDPGERRLPPRLPTSVPGHQISQGWTETAVAHGSVRNSEKGTLYDPAPDGRYRSLDLRGELANWGLAGPRVSPWDVDENSRSISIKGTSTKFIELTASGQQGLRKITISGQRGSRLQLTLLRLPDDALEIDVVARWSTTDGSPGVRHASGDHSATSIVRADIIAPPKSQWEIEHITCERHGKPTRQVYCFRGKNLAARRRNQFSTDTDQTTAFDLPVPEAQTAPAGWLLKVVARDKRGRRAVGWADLKAFQGKPIRTAGSPNAEHR